jgi:hypothetical protein
MEGNARQRNCLVATVVGNADRPALLLWASR